MNGSQAENRIFTFSTFNALITVLKIEELPCRFGRAIFFIKPLDKVRILCYNTCNSTDNTVNTNDADFTERRIIVLNIRLEGKRPIYEQLYNGIARLVSAGELSADEKLPAVREVAKQFGINPNTVQKAYSLLEQAGVIYSMPAKGSYVSGEKSAAEAVKNDTLKRVESEIRLAFRAGVGIDEIKSLAEDIWSEERNGDTDD